MIFSSPLLLWAFGLLTIPIIIHLFQFRRFKKVFFPDISLLREVQSKSKTKNELRHLLVLFTRLLFLALLVLAFAEPMIPSDQELDDSTERSISIYLDNSLSMQSDFEGFDLLIQAKQDAFEIINSYPNDTRFQLITNGFASAQRLLIDKETFISRLDEIEYSPQVREINDVLRFGPNENEVNGHYSALYLLSDFIGNLDTLMSNTDSNRVIKFVKYGITEINNVSIDSLWVDSPIVQEKSETELIVRIRNHSPTPLIDLPVSLEQNGNIEATALVTIEANGFIDTTFTFFPNQSGFLKGRISIDDSPIVFDNEFFFSLEVRKSLDILELSNSKKVSPFQKLFDGQEYTYQKMDVRQIRIDSIIEPDLIILNELPMYSSGLIAKLNSLSLSGKTILITLPRSLDELAKNNLSNWLSIEINKWDSSSLEINSIKPNDPLYANVFENQPENMNYPLVKGHWTISGINVKSLLGLYNQDPMLAGINHLDGTVFMLSTPLIDAYTNFHKHALFVPSVLNMPAFNGKSSSPYHTIGIQKIKTRIPKTEVIQMVSEINASTFMPGISFDGLVINDQIKKPGFYKIESDSTLHQLVAFNYDRKESLTKSKSEEEIVRIMDDNEYSIMAINREFSDISADVYYADFGKELWPYFLLASLLMFILETVLIKLFK